MCPTLTWVRLHVCRRKAALGSIFLLLSSLRDYPRGKSIRKTNDSSASQHPLCCQLRAVLWAAETQQDQIWSTASHPFRSKHRGAVHSYCIISLPLQCSKAGFCITVTIRPQRAHTLTGFQHSEHLNPSTLAVFLIKEPTAKHKASVGHFSKFSKGVE